MQTRVCKVCSLMEVSGIEPPTSCLQGRRSPKLSYTPDFESKLLPDAEHPARELETVWWA